MPRNSKPRRSSQQQKAWDRKQSSRHVRRADRRLSVRGELRASPDIRKIARVVISLAMAQAEADAEQQGQRRADDADQESPDE